MENFDELALSWDNEPRRVERARVVADEIIRSVPGLETMDGFEYGCGTGLLSFNLQSHLRKICLADSSGGLLEVLEQKIKKFAVPNMGLMKLDLTVDPLPASKFDVIYTLMTLHHIVRVEDVLKALYDMLNPHGYLCIADLDKEDGTFHDSDFTGHYGFDTSELSEKLMDIGFSNIKSKICYKNIKKDSHGIERTYPMFLLTGQKP